MTPEEYLRRIEELERRLEEVERLNRKQSEDLQALLESIQKTSQNMLAGTY